jgi:hypothetical protein
LTAPGVTSENEYQRQSITIQRLTLTRRAAIACVEHHFKRYRLTIGQEVCAVHQRLT